MPPAPSFLTGLGMLFVVALSMVWPSWGYRVARWDIRCQLFLLLVCCVVGVACRVHLCVVVFRCLCVAYIWGIVVVCLFSFCVVVLCVDCVVVCLLCFVVLFRRCCFIIYIYIHA